MGRAARETVPNSLRRPMTHLVIQYFINNIEVLKEAREKDERHALLDENQARSALLQTSKLKPFSKAALHIFDGESRMQYTGRSENGFNLYSQTRRCGRRTRGCARRTAASSCDELTMHGTAQGPHQAASQRRDVDTLCFADGSELSKRVLSPRRCKNCNLQQCTAIRVRSS